MKSISYSDGRTIQNPVIQIWDDLHAEKSGYFRAFWCETKDSDIGSTVIGYCSPGGSKKTIRAAVWEARKHYPDAEIYRNGRLVK